MNGQLNEHPLAELIREILLHRMGGTLRLKQEAVKAVVYFEAGEIIYAASNLKELRLNEYLRKQGLLSAEQLESMGNERSDPSLAAALTESRILDQQTVNRVIGKQVTDLLRVVLRWTEGTWDFDERAHLGDPIRVKLNVAELLLQAARKMNLQLVASRLSNPFEKISPVPGLPEFGKLSPTEGFVLSRVDSPMELNRLVSLSGLGDLEVMKTVYALTLVGFLEREYWPDAFKKARLEVGASAPLPAETSGEPVAEPDVSVHTLAAELQELLDRLKGASSHYEILDVESTADSADIKRSYYALARRYHPDRFHMQAGTPLHASIESAFARIAQAYVTLTDPAQRSGYDAKLAARVRQRQFVQEVPESNKSTRMPSEAKRSADGENSPETEWTRAESSFKEGFVALQQGQKQTAIVNLATAARLVPSEARFRAYYGRALAAVPDTRRLAEAELQAAIKLDPDNSAYRLMLAELFCDLGFLRRAAGELKRVISTEPNNSAAQSLRRRIEATGGST
ncbi:MAG: DUF4388 domain-containing protein [Pyrinomonadaceae bacterium]